MHLIETQGDILIGFPSLILRRKVANPDEINPGLGTFLRAERKANPARSTSAICGWQSGRDLINRGVPEIDNLMAQIGQAVLEITVAELHNELDPSAMQVVGEVWGNIMDNGDMTAIHNHVRDDWSGVYYVDAEAGYPNIELNGALELIDPRTVQCISGPNSLRSKIFRHITIKPENGMFLIWPAWMNHMVYRYLGPTERISLAFNLKVEFAE